MIGETEGWVMGFLVKGLGDFKVRWKVLINVCEL